MFILCLFFPCQPHFKKIFHILVKIHWWWRNVDLLKSFLYQRIFVAADCICRRIKKYIQLDFVGLIFCGIQHFFKPVPEGVCQVVIFSFENCKALYCYICFYHRVKIGNIAHVILICVDDSSPDFCNHFCRKIVALWKSRKQGVIVSCHFFCGNFQKDFFFGRNNILNRRQLDCLSALKIVLCFLFYIIYLLTGIFLVKKIIQREITNITTEETGTARSGLIKSDVIPTIKITDFIKS